MLPSQASDSSPSLTTPLSRRQWMALATSTALLPAAARAQGGAIKIVVPFAPGAGTDAVGRLMAQKLGEILGRNVVVENRTGASGAIGAQYVAQSAPDGNTLLLVAAPFTTVPAALPQAGYDPLGQFTPVGMIASGPLLWAVNKDLPVSNLKELIALARRQPGKLNYGSAGNGTSHHLAGELFKLQTKTFITHIPYRGSGPALQDLIAGQVDLMFDGLGSSATHIKSGRIKALAVAGSKRAVGFPDVPTAAEAGVPGYEVSTWYGLWAPKGTPADVQAKVVEDMKKSLASDELKAIWAQNGSEIPNLTMAAYGGFVNSEIKRWAAVVKASGAKLE